MGQILAKENSENLNWAPQLVTSRALVSPSAIPTAGTISILATSHGVPGALKVCLFLLCWGAMLASLSKILEESLAAF